MRKPWVILLIALAAVFGSVVPVIADPDLDARIGIDIGRHQPRDLDVYVWPDRGVDAVYYPGDPIRVLFEVTRDCYVVIYDIDTRGRVHILFPFDPWQDNFVEAGRVHELPGDWDDFSLTVEGPEGDECIQAIASPYPFDLPDWPIYLNSSGQYPTTCSDPELLDFRAGDDRVGYIQRVNRKISRHRWDWCATDLARFYVHPRPVYYDHYVPPYFDPWPADFYGAVYIGWPVGVHIYVDNVFVGVAPCWVHGISFGHHWVRAYDGDRLVREKKVRYRHKESYRKEHSDYGLKGIGGRDVYRTVRKAPPAQIEKSRAGTVPSKARTRGNVKQMPAPRPERTPADIQKRRAKAQREPELVEPPRKNRMDGSRRPGAMEKILSSAGRVLSETLDKPRREKDNSAKDRVQSSAGKPAKSNPSPAASKAQPRAESKKRR